MLLMINFFLCAIANLCSAAFLLLCAYFGTTTATAVPLITLSVGLGGLALSGVGVNHLDIAPKFAGILMGITNAAGTIPGIVGPQVAKAIAVQVCVCVCVFYYLLSLITIGASPSEVLLR